MHLRPYRFAIAFALSWLVLIGLAAPALAAGEKDKDAQKLLDKAMGDDYLAVEFAKAEKKLNEALKKCGKDGCTKPMLGKLHIALGTVYANMSPPKPDDAKNEYVSALQADPGAALDPSLKGPDTEKIFKEAQAAAGTGGKATPPTPPKTGDGDGDGDGDTPKKKGGGDITYKPTVTEQVVNTPVPIYIEIPDDVGAEKATLKYKPFGAKSWKSLEMKKVGDGYGVEIPCEDVTTTGDLKYYVVAKDATGDSAGTAGSSKQPYTVTVKNEIDGEAPTLPGKKAPDQCKAKEDCPPGLPGCPDKAGGKHGEKGWGDSCENSEECKVGYVCLNGSCEEGKDGEGGDDGKSSGKPKRNFASFAIGTDILFVGSADNVCSGGTGDSSHVCFQQSDSSQQFFGRPASVANTNAVQGGISFADVKLLLGYDRLISEKIPVLLGLRFGVGLGGGPSSPANSAPAHYLSDTGARLSGQPQDPASSYFLLHYEGRVGYQFTKFEPKKFRIVAFINGGGAQVNSSVPVTVCDTVDAHGDAVPAASSGVCKGKGKATQLNAYQITGLNFIGGGVGATYGLTASLGITLEVKAMVMLPTSGFVLEPTIGPTFGF